MQLRTCERGPQGRPPGRGSRTTRRLRICCAFTPQLVVQRDHSDHSDMRQSLSATKPRVHHDDGARGRRGVRTPGFLENNVSTVDLRCFVTILEKLWKATKG